MNILNLFSGNAGIVPNDEVAKNITLGVQPLLVDVFLLLERAATENPVSCAKASFVGNHYKASRKSDRVQLDLQVEFWNSSRRTCCKLSHIFTLDFKDEAESKDAVLQLVVREMAEWAEGKVELLKTIKTEMKD